MLYYRKDLQRISPFQEIITDLMAGKMARDAKITQIYEGTNQIQRNQIGLGLIKDSVAKK